MCIKIGDIVLDTFKNVIILGVQWMTALLGLYTLILFARQETFTEIRYSTSSTNFYVKCRIIKKS